MNRLKEFRDRFGWTQEELAERAGVSRPNISKWETKEPPRNYNTRLKLAKVLDTTPEVLFSGAPDTGLSVRPSELRDIGTKADRPRARMVPILGRVPAGEPLIRDENIEGWYPVPEETAKHDGFYLLRVDGNSMAPKGIVDGSLVIVDGHYLEPHNGDIVVVYQDGKSTVKIFERHDNTIFLKPADPTYPIIYVTKTEEPEVLIQGKVVGVIKVF